MGRHRTNSVRARPKPVDPDIAEFVDANGKGDTFSERLRDLLVKGGYSGLHQEDQNEKPADIQNRIAKRIEEKIMSLELEKEVSFQELMMQVCEENQEFAVYIGGDFQISTNSKARAICGIVKGRTGKNFKIANSKALAFRRLDPALEKQ
jgi:hypothetical protein